MPDQTTITLVAEKLAPFHGADERLGTLLALCVGRLMLKAARGGQDWSGISRDDDVRHVADWLKAAVVNDADWFRNVDEHGRPRKLLKFGTMEGLLKEADKAMRIEAQKLRGVKLGDGDEVPYAELSDGLHLVRLLTPAALDRESGEMQHCIGNGGYDDLVEDGDHLFLSLRDRHGKAHATLEIEDGAVIQLQGKQNKLPLQKYLDALVPFMRANRFAAFFPARLLGYVVDIKGNWHPLDDLPGGLRVSGDLDVSGTGITALPEGLRVGGSLYIGNTGMTALPEGLTVGRHLYSSHTRLTALPGGLRVGGSLFVSHTGLTALPDDLCVGGDLYIAGTFIEELPDDIHGNKRVVTNEGPMSAAKFRVAFSRNRSEQGQAAIGFG